MRSMIIQANITSEEWEWLCFGLGRLTGEAKRDQANGVTQADREAARKRSEAYLSIYQKIRLLEEGESK